MANVIGKFAVGKKSSVGRDPETVELQLRAAMNPLTRGRIRTTNTPLTGLFRQAVFGRLGGYDDINDADRPGRDSATQGVVG